MKKLLLILTALFGMTIVTGCGENPGPGPDPTPTHVTGVSLNKNVLNLEERGSETLIATVTPTELEQSKKTLTWESDNDNVAVVNGVGKVTGISQGTAVIKAISVDVPTISATCTVTVTKKDTDIHVTAVAVSPNTLNMTVGDINAVTATITPSNATNRNVNWSVEPASGVVTVGASGLVTAVGAGNAIITATTVDGGKTSSCSVTVVPKKEVIHVDSVTFNKNSLTIVEGTKDNLIATVLPENADNKELIWSVEPSDIAFVNNSGEIFAAKVGTAVIKATSKDDSSKYASANLEVIESTIHVESVELSNSLTVYLGTDNYLTAVVKPSTAANKKLEWDVEDDSVLGITVLGSDSIKITGKKTGTTKITATSEDGGKSATCTVTVSNAIDPTIHVTNLTLDKHKLDLQVGQKGNLLATIEPENADNKRVHWTVDPSDIAMVSEQGEVVALKKGEATITAQSEDIPSIKDTCTLTVTDQIVPVTGVTIANTFELDISKKPTDFIQATVLPENASNKNVSFEIVDETIAKINRVVNNTVEISAKKVGNTTLRVTTQDQGKQAECLVKVVDSIIHVTSITLDIASGAEFMEGDKVPVTPTILPENASNKEIEWSSSDLSVGFVSSANEFNALKAGEVTITATSKQDPSVKTSIDITVVEYRVPVESVTFDTESMSIAYGKTVQLKPTVLPADATNKDLDWESSEETVVTVDSYGYISGVGTGTSVVTATSQDDESISDSIAITVLPATATKVTSMENPDDIKEFISNTTTLDPVEDDLYTKSNLTKGNFFEPADETDLILKVGVDNPFKCTPKANALDKDGKAFTIANPKLIRSLSILNNDKFEEVDFDKHATLTGDNNIQFKNDNDTLGQIFRIDFKPDPTEYIISDPNLKISVEVMVVPGYNVYNVDELSLFDNSNSLWTTRRENAGITIDSNSIKALILQKNININSSDLPENIIWSKQDVDSYLTTAEGKDDFATWCNTMGFDISTDANYNAVVESRLYNSPRDSLTVLNRLTHKDGEYSSDFNFEGNFFAIDYRTVKEVAFLDCTSSQLKPGLDGFKQLKAGIMGDGSHSQLFGINAADASTNAPGTENVLMENFQMIGNAFTYPSKQTGKGGLIALKPAGCKLLMTNVNMHSLFTGVINEGAWDFDRKTERISTNQMSYTFDRIKAYDAYSSMFFLWGTINNTITNSWLTGSGGPLLLLDNPMDVDNKHTVEKDLYTECTCDIYNTYLKNELVGDEPWFEGHPGSGSLVQDAIINQGKTDGWIGGSAAYAYSQGLTNAMTITNKVVDDDETYYKCNFIALLAPVANFADNVYQNLRARLTIHNGEENNVCDLTRAAKVAEDKRSPDSILPEGPVWNESQPAIGDAAPFIGQSSLGGKGYLKVNTGGDPVPICNDPTLFLGNYFNYYVDPILLQGGVGSGKFLAAVLGTYPIANLL